MLKMTITEEESLQSSNSLSLPANGVQYLAKYALRSSVVLQVVHGHLRSSTSYDVVFGKETSIELVAIGEDGVVQSVCDQPVYGIIKDLGVLPWNKKSRARNPQMVGKDLLIVASDSGKLSFLTFSNEMHRFLPVTHVQLSDPGNLMHQIGRMLTVDSSGCFIAVSAYEDRLALFSVSGSNDIDMIDKQITYPPEPEADLIIRGLQNSGQPVFVNSLSSKSIVVDSDSTPPISPYINGTIWSMCFISKNSKHISKEDNPILAILVTRRGSFLNELLLLEWDVRENAIRVLSQFVEGGYLAHTITEVPGCHGLAILFRIGDVMLMDLTNTSDPCCVGRTELSYSIPMTEDYIHDADEEDLIAARALLGLQEYGMDIDRVGYPMNFGSDMCNVKSVLKYVCSWSWEPGFQSNPRMILSLDTGEFFLIEIGFDLDGPKISLSDCLYHSSPCKALLWTKGGYLAAMVEMGDGIILKFEDGRLDYSSLIQNVAPILDMSVMDYYDEKHDQMFACCGMEPEGSLRIIRSGISVEKLLTTPIYQGITAIWTVKMMISDSYHSFLVLSFVEETRVLSVGVRFTDVTDSVGFQPDVCTLACGLVDNGLLVQIHRNSVRVCLPTAVAHSKGIPMSSPAYTSWSPDNNIGISLGSVGHNLIVVATSNPCFFIILGVRLLSLYHYEIYEMQHIRLQSELSCISIPQKHIPVLGVNIGYSFVIGTHKPSVEILCYTHGQDIRVLATGKISLTNTTGTAITGCIPQDVRIVLVDRLYVLSGLRNGMLLRFDWPTTFAKSSSFKTSSLQLREVNSYEEPKDNDPVNLQLIAVRRIGITPVLLVPLDDSLDSDVIALSDRCWLVQVARQSLSCISISVQPSTYVTPVCSAECPKGLLFVVENSLHLVEMMHNKRLNVQKFHLGGTPRKVLYHSESRLLLVLRTDLGNDSFSSDICYVDPLSGSMLSSFKFDWGETGKSMALMRVGNDQVLVVGTSLSAGPAIMPSGEAESTKGRLVVLCLEHSRNADSGSSCDGVNLADSQAWQLRLANSIIWPGVVVAICPYLGQYFLASFGNAFYVCGFPNDNPEKIRRYAVERTRFMIVSLTTYFTRIAVGDCRDGVLFYTYFEETRDLEQIYCDPNQRLVADCLLTDGSTAIVSDRKGSITVLTSSTHLEDNQSPERNLTVCSSYYMGEVAVSIRKGSFSYNPPVQIASKGCDGGLNVIGMLHNGIMAGTLLGSIVTFIPISREDYKLLEVVEARLAVHPLTAPILGNNHSEFRSRENKATVPSMLDGDMLAQFLELTSIQQEAVLALPSATAQVSSSSPVPINQVVQLLERILYALN